MKYFKDCQTVDEAKELFRKLMLQYHPDRNTDPSATKITQDIISEFKEAISYLSHNTKKKYYDENAGFKKEREYTQADIDEEFLQAEEYQAALNKVINLPDIKIEIIGTWLWVSGDTRKHKDVLKAQPSVFTWAKKKDDFSAWFFRTEENKSRNRTKMTLDEIRTYHGSKEINSKKSFQITKKS